jgi:hypothetical protein
MIRLYHPELGAEIEAGDEAQAAVLAESGWLPAPEPEATSPHVVPEPTKYEPVKPAAKTASKTAKSTNK